MTGFFAFVGSPLTLQAKDRQASASLTEGRKTKKKRKGNNRNLSAG